MYIPTPSSPQNVCKAYDCNLKVDAPLPWCARALPQPSTAFLWKIEHRKNYFSNFTDFTNRGCSKLIEIYYNFVVKFAKGLEDIW